MGSVFHPAKDTTWAEWATEVGGGPLRVLISPQGMLVNRVFRAHLVSQALSVPKVSPVTTQCPGLPCPGRISEVQALGAQTALIHSSRADRPREGPPPQKSIPGYQDWSCIFGSVVNLGVMPPSLFFFMIALIILGLLWFRVNFMVICPNSANRCFLPRNSLLSEIPCSYMQNEGFGQENP